jgi:hypothetical protein
MWLKRKAVVSPNSSRPLSASSAPGHAEVFLHLHWQRAQPPIGECPDGSLDGVQDRGKERREAHHQREYQEEVAALAAPVQRAHDPGIDHPKAHQVQGHRQHDQRRAPRPARVQELELSVIAGPYPLAPCICVS